MDTNIKERSNTIDVMKCILIILVVIGHYPNTIMQDIIFWFHMPLFFVISGYLFKGNHEKLWVRKTIIKYLIPYFSYFLIILSLRRKIILSDIIKFLYGGRMYSGVYWFIPCMLITILIFYFLTKKFSKKNTILIIISMYILAHFEANYFLPHNGDYLNWNIIYKIPLNLDVCLMSTVYFAIGFYYKDIIIKIINNINIPLYITVSLICLIFITLNLKGIVTYELNMKLGHYYNFLMDILVPVIFGIWIVVTSSIINKMNIKLFTFIGMNTLPIMYFHIPFNAFFQSKFGYGIIGYVLVGIFPALIFSYICSKNRYLEFIFKGVTNNLEHISITKKFNNFSHKFPQ